MKTIIHKSAINFLSPVGKYSIILIIINLAIVASAISQNNQTDNRKINKKAVSVSVISQVNLAKYPVTDKMLNRKYLNAYDKIEKFDETEPTLTYTTSYTVPVNEFTLSKVDGKYLKKYDKIEKFPEFEYPMTYIADYSVKITRKDLSKINGDYLKKYDKVESFPENEYLLTYVKDYSVKITRKALSKINADYLKKYDKIEKFPEFEAPINYAYTTPAQKQQTNLKKIGENLKNYCNLDKFNVTLMTYND